MTEMAVLPSEFSQLEPFAERWCLATEGERWAERMSSTIDEMQEFYDAIIPQVPDAIAYCDKFPLTDMPEDALDLLRLIYSFVIVSFPVELWRQPGVPDTAGTDFVRVSEPQP
jgi:hypothetical protein